MMTAQDIRDLIQREKPFRPFRLTLTDGRTYDVHHPEMVVAGRTAMFLGMQKADEEEPIYERYVIIALSHIMQAQPLDTVESS